MSRLAALGFAIALSGAAPAPETSQTVPKPTAPQTASPTGVDNIMLLLGDSHSRMTVPVSIGQTGPFDFIVDTGSERSIVSRELAGQLNLAPGPRVHVTAITGDSLESTVIVPSLNISRIRSQRIEAPALDSAHLGAPGMVGIDALQGHAVSIDFDRREMTIRPTRKHSTKRPEHDEIVVRAKSRYGQLIVTDASYHGRRISVVIDTGSSITIGNLALRRRLIGKPTPLAPVTIISATGGTMIAEYLEIDRLTVGDVGFNHVPIAFADALPFKHFDLVDKPALLLGMDTLRLFRNVDIDFTNREIRFTVPRGTQPYRG